MFQLKIAKQREIITFYRFRMLLPVVLQLSDKGGVSFATAGYSASLRLDLHHL